MTADFTAFLLLAILGMVAVLCLLVRRGQQRRNKIMSHYEKWRQRFQGQFDRVAGLIDRATILKESTSFLSGSTLDLTRDAIREVDQLYLISAGTEGVLATVYQCLRPQKVSSAWIQTLRQNDFDRAEYLMGSKSVGFVDTIGRNVILYSNTERQGYRELVGGEDEYHPFAMSLEEVDETLGQRFEAAEQKIRRLEAGINLLPLCLEKGAGDLVDLSRRLGLLEVESRRDGFFPLKSLRERLIPSAEAILDNAIRRAVIDPVAAYESPCKVALRQIEDAMKIVGVVETVRKDVFPAVEQVARHLEARSIHPAWINLIYFEHSETLETIASHSVLWPGGSALERFQQNLERSRIGIQSAMRVVNRIYREILPQLQTIEDLIAKSRIEFGRTLEISPEQVLREGDFDPTVRTAKARALIQGIMDLIGSGLLEPAEKSLPLVEEQLRETDQSLKVSRNVIEHGDVFFEETEERLAVAMSRFPGYEGTLLNLKKFDPLVFDLQEKFGFPLQSREPLETNSTVTASRLKEAEIMLAGVLDAFKQGRLLTAGSLLQAAATEVQSIEFQLVALESQAKALGQALDRLDAMLSQCRFRLRALGARVIDRRTRQASLNAHGRIGDLIRRFEAESLKKSAPTNPFRCRRDLEEIDKQLTVLERMVDIDWDLHEAATQSVKRASRTLRSQRESVERHPSGSMVESTRERIEEFRPALEQWQIFLEGRHCDWIDAFLGAVELENNLVSTGAVLEGKQDEAEIAARGVTEASRRVAERCHRVPQADASVGLNLTDGLLDHARLALINGDYQRAQAMAVAASQQAEAAINHDRARETRAAAEEQNRKRQQAEALIDSRFGEILDENFPLTTSATESLHPVNGSLKRGFGRQNLGHSRSCNAEAKPELANQEQVEVWQNQPETAPPAGLPAA